MKPTFAFFLMVLSFQALGQTVAISKGEIPLGIQVIHRQKDVPMDLSSLCEGFDENGLPIDLLVPNYAKAIVFIADHTSGAEITYSRIVDIPINGGFDGFEKGLSMLRKDFVYEGDSVWRVFDDPLASNSLIQLSVVKRQSTTRLIITNTDKVPLSTNQLGLREGKNDDGKVELDLYASLDTVHFSFQTHFDPVKVEEAYLDSEMADLMINTINRDVFDLSNRTYENWIEKGYSRVTSPGEVPQNPVFPHTLNSLFLKISEHSKKLDIWLEKDGQRLPSEAIKSNGRVIIIPDLTPGDYKLVFSDQFLRFDPRITSYEFSVKSGFWQEGSYWLIILLPLFAIFFGVYRTYTKAKLNRLYLTQQLTDAELTAIRAQLNPHFLFNALSAIQNLVNKDDSENANDYIVRLSKLMRLVLNRSSESFHSLSNEIEIAELYLSLEKLRTDFEYEIEVDQEVDQNMLVPTLLLQPYLENSVIHGIQANGGSGIHVQISKEGSNCILKIKDNGQGLSDKKGNGKGMQMSSERLKVIENRHGVETTVNAGPTETGYQVTIKIPNDL